MAVTKTKLARTKPSRKCIDLGIENYLAIDTETTGPELYKHPCQEHVSYPFIITACDDSGYEHFWEVPVHPATRRPSWSKALVSDIRHTFSKYPYYVFHNLRFDLRALRSINLFTEPLDLLWPHLHDTLCGTHALDSAESHGLKPLAIKYLDMLDHDAELLHDLTIKARVLAKRDGYYTYDQVTDDLGTDDAMAPDMFFVRHYLNTGELIAPREVPDPVRFYAGRDAVRTALLWRTVYHALHQENLWEQYIRERNVLLPTYLMEESGVNVIPDLLEPTKKKFLQQTESAKRLVQSVASKYNHPDLYAQKTWSPKKTKLFFFGPTSDDEVDKFNAAGLRTLGLPILAKSAKTGAPSLNADVIDIYVKMAEAGQFDEDTEIAITNYASHGRTRTAYQYLESYDKRATRIPAGADIYCPNVEFELWRIFPTLNPSGTATTRFSHSNPNTANIGKDPKKANLREVFGPPPGHWWYCIDYSQLELRIVAVAAKERRMLKVFEAGGDIHDETGLAVYGKTYEAAKARGEDNPDFKVMRRGAKAINFGIIYGMGLEKSIRITGQSDFRERFNSHYPDLARYMNQVKNHAEQYGYVHTLGGYKLCTPPDRSYAGLNYIVQGSAGDIMKDAMIALHHYFRTLPPITYGRKMAGPRFGPRMIMSIHDEIVFEVHKNTPTSVMLGAASIMEAAGNRLGVYTPIEVSKTDTVWSAARKLTPNLANYVDNPSFTGAKAGTKTKAKGVRK